MTSESALTSRTNTPSPDAGQKLVKSNEHENGPKPTFGGWAQPVSQTRQETTQRPSSLAKPTRPAPEPPSTTQSAPQGTKTAATKTSGSGQDDDVEISEISQVSGANSSEFEVELLDISGDNLNTASHQKPPK